MAKTSRITFDPDLVNGRIDPMDYERIILLVLAGAFAVFVILGIAVTYQIYKITRDIRRVADKVEKVASSAAAASTIIKKTATPAAILSAIGKAAGAYSKSNGSKASKKDKKGSTK